MKVYMLCVGSKANNTYDIADVTAHSIEEALVTAAVELGWNFDEIRERF